MTDIDHRINMTSKFEFLLKRCVECEKIKCFFPTAHREILAKFLKLFVAL